MQQTRIHLGSVTCLVLMLLVCIVSPKQVEANDAAVETAAGGLQLRDEQRVSMIKERLYIGKQFIAPVPSKLPSLENKYRVIVEPESTGNSAGGNSSNIEKCLLSWQKRG